MRLLQRGGLVVVVVGVVLVAGISPAMAEDHTDWVPPGLVTTTGRDVSGLTVGGQIAPATPGLVVVEAAPPGQFCTMKVDSVTWDDSNTAVFVYWHTSELSGAGWCEPPTQVHEPYIRLLCQLNNVFTWVEGGILGRVPAWWVSHGLGYQMTGCPNGVNGANDRAPVGIGWLPNNGGNAAADGFTSYDPSVQLGYTIHVVCSDASETDTLGVYGIAQAAASCPAGTVMVSAAVVDVGGLVVGTVATHSGFPSECSSGTCLPFVLFDGSYCSPNDPTCTWWGGTAGADGCRWGPADGSMFAPVDPVDCVAARSSGKFHWDSVTPPSSTPTPTPTPTPDNGSGAIVSAVQAAGSAIVSAINQVKSTVQGIASTVAAIPAAITRAVVPDAGVMSGLVGQAKGAMGSPLSGWTDALAAIAGAWSGSPAGCAGPALALPAGYGNMVTLHPMSACDPPMSTLAALVRIGAAVVMLTSGAWTCVRNLSSALGYSA